MYKLSSEPSEKAVQEVIDAVGCPRTRAKLFLKVLKIKATGNVVANLITSLIKMMSESLYSNY